MKIEFHPQILRQQCYQCNCCGQGCRSFLVPLRAEERQAIEALENWQEKLQAKELFVRSRAAGPSGYGLAKRNDGRCVFLDDDNLCIIHKLHGLRAKPLACQLYPFVLVPFADKLRVGLRFDCPAVCQNHGQSLTTYRKELNQLAQQLVPPDPRKIAVPSVRPGQYVSYQQLDAINEMLLRIVADNTLPLTQRLHWLDRFVEHLGRIKWQNLPDDDLPELLVMFQSATLAELKQTKSQPQPMLGEPRKLLGQIFFLLSQPTTIIHTRRENLISRLRKRARSVTTLKRLSRTSRPLPKIQPHWPDCNLADLEGSFHPWPNDVQEMLSRYLTSRLAALNYCGSSFYHYSLLEGIQTLLLAMATIGWLMRIEAVKAQRHQIVLEDAHTAVMTVDGNLGYSNALAMGPARLRLSYLSNHLQEFIDWYCQ